MKNITEGVKMKNLILKLTLAATVSSVLACSPSVKFAEKPLPSTSTSAGGSTTPTDPAGTGTVTDPGAGGTTTGGTGGGTVVGGGDGTATGGGTTGGGTTGGGTTGGTTCSEVLQNITVPVKLLFVVDTSGSNLTGDFGSNIGTDPSKAVRAGSIQEFFNNYGAKPNFSWSMITFSNYSANSLINSNLGIPYISPSASDMQNAITQFLGMTDGGNTPYDSALSLVASEISNDTMTDSRTKYIVVFMSDGMPNPANTDTHFFSAVQNIVGLVPGQVSFSTVYYGSVNPSASSLMQGMADIGGGNFLNTNTNPTGKYFQISDIVTVPGVVCN